VIRTTEGEAQGDRTGRKREEELDKSTENNQSRGKSDDRALKRWFQRGAQRNCGKSV